MPMPLTIRHAEGDLRPPRIGQVLHDHVHDDAARRDRLEDARAIAGPVGQVEDGDAALVGVEQHVADDDVFHARQAMGDRRQVAAGGRLRLTCPDGGWKRTWPVPAGRPEPGRGFELERLMHGPQRALTPSALSTSTEILMSPVVIIFMLTPAAARAANIFSATPVCVRMPVPTIETLLTPSSCSDLGAPVSAAASGPAHGERRVQFDPRHREADGRLAAGADVLGDHVDGDVLGGDGGEETRWLTPGSVGHADRGDAGLVLDDGGAADDRPRASSRPRARSRCLRRR